MRLRAIAFSAALVAVFGLAGASFHLGRRTAIEADVARAESGPDVKEVLLPAGTKLKDANWHCYAGGWCELWYLTKPRPASDKPETYVFQNVDGSRKYVIKEQ